MSDDFLESMHEESELRFGRRLSPAEAAQKFSGHSMDARVQHLRNLKTPESMTIHQASERHKYESALRGIHEKMRRLGR